MEIEDKIICDGSRRGLEDLRTYGTESKGYLLGWIILFY
jgi:hypothetical protein